MEEIMPRVFATFMLATVPLLTMGSAVALAASPSQQECQQMGGTLQNENGTKVCSVSSTTNVGNSSNSQTTTTSTTTTGQGNLGNKTTTSSSCSGPGNSGSSSAHC
jgi:hypothetical protein